MGDFLGVWCVRKEVIGLMIGLVGLGNGGKEYEKRRDNVGFMRIDEVWKKWDIGLNE